MTAAANGAVAPELLKNGVFDLFLTDIRRPAMSGVEPFRRVRARPAATHDSAPPLRLLPANEGHPV